MRTVLLLTLLVLLPLTHIHAVTADTSCGIIWDEPILLSDTTRDAYSPKIALSGDDTVHITWENGSFTIRLPYVRSTTGGESFEGKRELLDDSISFPGKAVWTNIVASGQNAYVFFVGSTAGATPVRMLRSTNGGTDWSGVVDISPDTCGIIQNVGTYGDTLAIIYPPRPFPFTRRILRSTNAGLTWTQAGDTVNTFAKLALSSQVLHLVQIESNEIQYKRSYDLGDTWVQQTFLSIPDGIQSLDESIAASPTPGETSVIAAWRDPKYGCIGVFGCSIIGRTGRAGDSLTAWQEEQVHTPEPRGFEPSLSTRADRYAAGWRYEVDPGTTFHALVRLSHIGDTSWCPALDLTPTTIHKVINIEVALSAKAIHTVWEQNVAPDPSTFRIFYRRGRFIDTDVEEEPEALPSHTMLEQNYPNPFNPSTIINYQLAVGNFVSLKVYDMLGREVAMLVNEKTDAGEHAVEWNAEGMPSGVYCYRLMTGGRVQTRKAILIR